MKKALLIAALLLPAAASAQIYPLQEYAKAVRDSGQELKFLRSPNDVTYVATCKGSGESKLCDLAKNGSYKTNTGLRFVVKESQLRSAEDTSQRCDYVSDGDDSKLDCKD
jgi:hypothetical protein